jgi:hypothetical protein
MLTVVPCRFPDLEIGTDRRAPIVAMSFSHDGKRLFFVNSRRDYIRSMYIGGPAGAEIHSSTFNNNLARQGAGLDVQSAHADVLIAATTFSGDAPSPFM